jgi:glycosyltransferase involved in cell wall biosynthesis
MRVALYLKHFPAAGTPIVGGTSTWVNGIGTGLARNGADVVVLCEGSERSTVTAPGGYRIECFRSSGRYRNFRVSAGLRRYAAEQLDKSSVCVLNGIFHPSCFAFGRVLRQLGVPYVAIPNDPYDEFMFSRNPHLKWPYWYLFERRHLRDAHAVQLLDQRHEAPLRRLGIATPMFESPCGIAESQAIVVPGPHPTRQAASLLFLGRIDAYNKGLDLLLEAFARVTAMNVTPVTLTLRGPDWGDRATLARRAEALGLSGSVTFADPDYARTPVELIGDHDMLCLPSRFEGFGHVALEAMLAGRVVLVSERAGVARHIVASGAGLAAAPTVEGITTGLLAMLQRRGEWQAMGRLGRDYVLDSLQWNSIAKSALASYAQLVAPGAAHG